MVDSPTVFIVEDDDAVAAAIQSACALKNWPTRRFASAESFMASESRIAPGCMVLDLRLPGINGLELQAKLAELAPEMPVILTSGHADVESAVSGMRKGALTLLQKPFHSRQIISAIEEAMERVKDSLAKQEEKAQFDSLLAGLTEGELATAALVVEGKTNKQIAAILGLSVRGVEDRRSRLMKHFRTRSVAEFVNKVTPILDARQQIRKNPS